MKRAREGEMDRATLRFMQRLAEGEAPANLPPATAAELLRRDLAERGRDGALRLNAAGHAFLARVKAGENGVDAFRAQHMALTTRMMGAADEAVTVTVNDHESPLAWLARRKGRDGRMLISQAQYFAGERLRAEFTRAQMTPRVTTNWSSPMGGGRNGAGGAAIDVGDRIVAARQRVARALSDAGPEFSGLLLDVCCFLHGLEDVERKHGWPPRSGKIVLQLALDRLARHYGLSGEAQGHDHVHVRTWLAEGAQFAVDGGG